MHISQHSRLSRRQFAFLCGGLGAVASSKLSLAQDMLLDGDPSIVVVESDIIEEQERSGSEHWRSANNGRWRWFERESLVDGQWKVTGITQPYDLVLEEFYDEQTGYLDESMVPDEIRQSEASSSQSLAIYHGDYDVDGEGIGVPHIERRSRHGRPPSEWLRQLEADELRIWLKTIRVPQAGVSGMTFWEHLTRDHEFDPERIAGLNELEQEMLHSAAHHGY